MHSRPLSRKTAAGPPVLLARHGLMLYRDTEIVHGITEKSPGAEEWTYNQLISHSPLNTFLDDTNTNYSHLGFADFVRHAQC